MEFKTQQQLYKLKKQTAKGLSEMWYTLVYPLAWSLDKIDYIKHRRLDKKVANMSVQNAGKFMARHIYKEMIEEKKRYEFYVCKSDYSKYVDETNSFTVIDYILEDLHYISNKKYKYKVLYEWAEIQHRKGMNDVWLNGELCQIIYDELCDVDGIHVYWEYETELTDKRKYWRPMQDYQKHLIIEVDSEV